MSDVIGYITKQSAEAKVTKSNGEVLELGIFSQINQNDLIETFDGSSLEITLDNGNIINIDGQRTLSMDETVYENEPFDVNDVSTKSEDDIIADIGEEETEAGEEGPIGSGTDITGGLGGARIDNRGFAYAEGLESTPNDVNVPLEENTLFGLNDEETGLPGAGVVSTEDTTAPLAPTINPVGLSNDSTPTISGQGEPGSLITISIDGSVVGSTTADTNGNWSYETNILPDGIYSVEATATDSSGNVSETSAAQTFTLDTVAPAVTVDDIALTNDTTPEITGTVNDDNAVIIVTVNGIDYPAVNNGNGTWTLADDAVTELEDGSTTVTVTATDPAGNTSTSSGTVTVANAAPTLTVDPTATMDEDNGSVSISYTAADTDGTILSTTASVPASQGTLTIDEAAQTVTFTPAANFNGDATITITTTDNDGATATASSTITVNPINDAATITLTGTTAAFTEDATAAGDQVATFTTADEDGDAVTVALSDTTNYALSGNTVVLTQAGADLVNSGADLPVFTISATDTIQTNPATADVTPPATTTVNDGAAVEITGTTNVGDTLTATVTDPDGTATSTITYEWSADGVVLAGATGSTYDLTDAEVGKTITVQATYTDDQGFTEDVTASTATTVAPFITLTSVNTSIAEGTDFPFFGGGTTNYAEWKIDLPSAKETDVTVSLTLNNGSNGDNPTVNQTDNGALFSAEDFSSDLEYLDATGVWVTVTGGSVTIPAGDTSISVRNKIIPDLFLEPDEVYHLVAEVDGITVVSSDVIIENDDFNWGPIAGDDAYTTLEDTPFELDLLNNDVDWNFGDTIRVKSIDGVVLSGDAELITVTNGTIDISSDGIFTFIPGLNFNGDINFDYVITDGVLDDTASVSITVTPVADALLPDAGLNVVLGEPTITTQSGTWQELPDGTIDAGGVIISSSDTTNTLTLNPGNGVGVDDPNIKIGDDPKRIESGQDITLDLPTYVTSLSITLKNTAADSIVVNITDINGTVTPITIPSPNNNGSIEVIVLFDVPFNKIELLGDATGYSLDSITTDVASATTFTYPLTVTLDMDLMSESLGTVTVSDFQANAKLYGNVIDNGDGSWTIDASSYNFTTHTFDGVYLTTDTDIAGTGFEPTLTVTSTEGATEASTILGGTEVQGVDAVLEGGAGNDYIDGNDGYVKIDGAAGDDKLVFDNADLLIDGGTGFDTLIFNTDEVLDFSTIDSLNNPVTNVEQIDLSNANVTLDKLTLEDVLDLTGSGTELTILGTSNDTVNLQDSTTSWAANGQVSENGRTFDVYTNDTVTVKIEQDINDTIVT